LSPEPQIHCGEQVYYPFIRDVLVKGGFKMLTNTFALPN
jgi:hypothetical protein